jgi:PAS domain-containing protein
MLFRNLTLKTKILLFFGLFILLTLANWFLYWYAEEAYKHNNAYVQVSKQNSLQLQQVVFFIRNIADGKKNNLNNVTREMKVLDENLKILKEGGLYEGLHDITLEPTDESNLEIYSKLTDVMRQWREFRNHVVSIVDTNPIRLDSTFAYLAVPDVDPNNMKTQKIDFLNPQVTPHLDYVVKNTEKLLRFNEDLITFYYEYAWEQRRSLTIAAFLVQFMSLLSLCFGAYFIVTNTIAPLKKIAQTIADLGDGRFTRNMEYGTQDEIGEVVSNMNTLVESMENISGFAANVGKGNFQSDFQVRGTEDKLGFALLNMRDNLQKVAEEDKKRNWANEGMAKFAEILRNTQLNVNEISYNIISNLVKYIGANQGGLFILEDSEDESRKQTLVLSAAYAYNKKKYLEKEIRIGQGLLGQAVLERNMIYLTDIPNNYISITSGLGEANPNALLIMPLQANNVIYGVIEIASFHELKDYQIDFIEKLSESIAITISTVQNSDKNRKLLDESQMFAELMKAQEEEMRQNMEELTATQEEMRRVQLDIKEKENSLNDLINNTQDAMLSIDANLVVSVYNKAATSFFADKGVQIKAQTNFIDALNSEMQQSWRTYCSRALSGETFTHILHEKSPEYEDIYTLLAMQPIQDYEGNKAGFTVFLKDISHLTPIRWEQ